MNVFDVATWAVMIVVGYGIGRLLGTNLGAGGWVAAMWGGLSAHHYEIRTIGSRPGRTLSVGKQLTLRD